MASGGEDDRNRRPMYISQEDEKMLRAFKSLRRRPDIDSSEDLKDIIHRMDSLSMKENRRSIIIEDTITKPHHSQVYQKLSVFFGEPNTGIILAQNLREK
ncbi:hypothetical protein DPMN_157447 [Dreissena polymorpha]|uniref:Uncharacterized protein n=1 Tax=Dreissena polymorpha TaxID=45954 RepID=A0A9D4EHS7_DREPO|nr:hypothetical protein DPMN_157381 [Dreissena polymorpha]KAH3779642.1 hypothetical protein DPMN_157447 [Dreissena polymorpha]